MFKAFKSDPASINFAEVYTALQTGVVDARKTTRHHFHSKAVRSAKILLSH